jgi:hypothetical protein
MRLRLASEGELREAALVLTVKAAILKRYTSLMSVHFARLRFRGYLVGSRTAFTANVWKWGRAATHWAVHMTAGLLQLLPFSMLYRPCSPVPLAS